MGRYVCAAAGHPNGVRHTVAEVEPLIAIDAGFSGDLGDFCIGDATVSIGCSRPCSPFSGRAGRDHEAHGVLLGGRRHSLASPPPTSCPTLRWKTLPASSAVVAADVDHWPSPRHASVELPASAMLFRANGARRSTTSLVVSGASPAVHGDRWRTEPVRGWWRHGKA